MAEKISVTDLFHEALQTMNMLMTGEKVTALQVASTGMFFGWFSRLLAERSRIASSSLTLESASAELAAIAQRLSGTPDAERLQVIARFLADSTWMESV